MIGVLTDECLISAHRVLLFFVDRLDTPYIIFLDIIRHSHYVARWKHATRSMQQVAQKLGTERHLRGHCQFNGRAYDLDDQNSAEGVSAHPTAHRSQPVAPLDAAVRMLLRSLCVCVLPGVTFTLIFILRPSLVSNKLLLLLASVHTYLKAKPSYT